MDTTDGTERRPTVFLHVGAPKTGTTYLQRVLWRNQHALERGGVLFPGQRPVDHFHAALDLRGVRFQGHDDPAVPGAWERLCAQARRWQGPAVVISHEVLVWATEEHARKAVESLRPADVHVVYTARDLVRQIPAVWQESVKNRRLVGFPRYLQSLRAPNEPGPWGRAFWAAQDPVDVLRRWGAAVPPERMHVVTVPPAGEPQGVLWERFAGLLDLDPARYRTDLRGSNVSLGRAEVEVLRRVNRMLGDDVDWPTYEHLFKRQLAEGILARRPGAQKVTLPPEWHPWAVEQSERIVKGLREGGYDVVGDLEELLPRQPEREPGRDDDRESDRERGHPSGREGDAAPENTPAPGTEPRAQLDLAAEVIAQLMKERAAPPAAGSSRRWRRLYRFALAASRRADRLAGAFRRGRRVR